MIRALASDDASIVLRAWRLLGAALWFGAIVVPLVGLILSLVLGPAPKAGWAPSARQLTLLGKTAGLAAVTAGLALSIALPTVRVLGRRLGGVGPAWPFLAVPLMLPPYVCAFGWDALLSPWLSRWLGDAAGWVRAAVVWAGWSWPIPALLVAGGWRRVGQAAYRAALLEAEAGQAFRRAVLPILAGHAAVAAVILWMIFLIEYNVPHACSIQVFATELLAWGQSSRHAIDVVWPALPVVAVAVLAASGALALWRGHAAADDQQAPPPAEVGARRWRSLWPVVLVFALAVLLPLGGLIARLDSLNSFSALWRIYRTELLESLAIAAGTGLAVVCVGTWLAADARAPFARRAAVVLTIAFGLMPGALVGEAIVVAYRNVDVIYDQWPVMVLTQVARWAWIGWLAGWLVRRSASTILIDQACTDGASRVVARTVIGWRTQWAILAAAGALAGGLCLAEVAAMSMVRPPGIGWMAQTLMEKFHRFEDQMLVTISLVLVLAPIPALALGALAWRMRGGDDAEA